MSYLNPASAHPTTYQRMQALEEAAQRLLDEPAGFETAGLRKDLEHASKAHKRLRKKKSINGGGGEAA